MTDTSPTTLAAVDQAPESGASPDFWFQLIDEKAAGEFIGVTARTMQSHRQKGGGSKFVRISARCIRYRRCDLREWADARLRESTSDPGAQAA